MKAFVSLFILSCLLFSSSTLACACLFRRATQLSAASAILLELTSAGTALFSISNSTSAEQDKVYHIQTGAYFVSAVTLLLGILCAGTNGIDPCFGTFSLLLATVGMGANVWERFKYPTQSDIARVAFTTGWLGFFAHIASVVFRIIHKNCDLVPQETGLLSDV